MNFKEAMNTVHTSWVTLRGGLAEKSQPWPGNNAKITVAGQSAPRSRNTGQPLGRLRNSRIMVTTAVKGNAATKRSGKKSTETKAAATGRRSSDHCRSTEAAEAAISGP